MTGPARKRTINAETASLAIEVMHDLQGWVRMLPTSAPLCRRAARAAFRAVPRRRRPHWAALVVVLTGDARMRRLNHLFRGRNRPTNVLAFADPSGGREGKGRVALGDVVLGLGVIRREARAQRKSLSDHVAHLVVHGVLHLLDYDHQTPAQARLMEQTEIRILAGLGIANPYLADSETTPTRRRRA